MQIDNDDDQDGGADVFWPGYVDAVTNLVLNLLFVVVIMTVAVFIFAMELGRQHPSKASAEEVKVAAEPSIEAAGPQDEAERLKREIASLQQKLKALKSPERLVQSAEAATHHGERTVIAASTTRSKPITRLENVSGTVLVDFTDEAVTLSDDEVAKLQAPLLQIVGQGQARIDVSVPPGFTEARRLGFYRAMAVRNQLIKLGLPSDRIILAVSDGSPASDATLVSVSVQR